MYRSGQLVRAGAAAVGTRGEPGFTPGENADARWRSFPNATAGCELTSLRTKIAQSPDSKTSVNRSRVSHIIEFKQHHQYVSLRSRVAHR